MWFEANRKHLQEVMEHFSLELRDVKGALAHGFELCIKSGPLMQEPVLGACFVIEDIEWEEKPPE